MKNVSEQLKYQHRLKTADDEIDETEKKLWNYNYELFELVFTASLTVRFSGKVLQIEQKNTCPQ